MSLLTRNLEYVAVPPSQGFGMVQFDNESRRSRVVVGFPQENVLHPVDPAALFDLGGPGGIMQVSQVDLNVRDAVGLQVRDVDDQTIDDEEGWQTIADVTPADGVGETLPLYTGVLRADINTDMQNNGIDLQIRAIGPREATVCSMALDVQRNK